MRIIAAWFVLAIVGLGSLADAGNWGHWRGSTGNGTALEASPPTEWSSTKNVKWKIAIPGRGSSSPVIWGDQVFITTAVPSHGKNGEFDFKLLCFDRNDGKTLWEKTAVTTRPHQGTHNTNGYASASPCTDGQHVYAPFGSRGLFGYTMSGDLTWKRDDFGKMDIRNNFGEGSSPTIEGNKILLPWDHQGSSAIYALDKLTGDTIWKTDREEPTCWATPLVVDSATNIVAIPTGKTRNGK